jgi:CPA2 family monovalent cation:H+ antiporter-2
VLADNDDLHTQPGHIAVGWLVVEDLFTVLALVLLPAVFGAGADSAFGVIVAIGVAFVKVAAMVGLTFVVGERVIPWLLDKVAATRSRELFTLTVLVVALGIAVTAAKVFDVSMALGAFLAGMVVGRSQFSLRAASEALPMRDAFAVLFFVSVGMLFDWHALVDTPGLVAATLAVILLGKPLAALIIVLLLRYPARAAVTVSVVLAQIGEFSFILASGGKALGVLDADAANVIIAAAIITITLNPILYRLVDPLERLVIRFVRPSQPVTNGRSHELDDRGRAGRHRAVLVGYGPVGKTLAHLLHENQIEPVVIELNMDTVRRLGEEGVRAVYGDALHREVLEHAGLSKAVSLILSSSTMHGGKETIRLARDINPDLFILARTSYLRDVAELRGAGADSVFSGEGEVALAMTEFLLSRLGATPEQIDRERARVRAEFSHIIHRNGSAEVDADDHRGEAPPRLDWGGGSDGDKAAASAGGNPDERRVETPDAGPA